MNRRGFLTAFASGAAIGAVPVAVVAAPKVETITQVKIVEKSLSDYNVGRHLRECFQSNSPGKWADGMAAEVIDEISNLKKEGGQTAEAPKAGWGFDHIV